MVAVRRGGDTLADLGSRADERSLAIAAKTDRAAFGVLYDRYVARIYGYCSRWLRTAEEAEDATSLVFTKALAAMPRYREDGPSFGAWIFAIAHNVVVDVLRSRSPDYEAVDVLETFPDAELGPEDWAILADDVRELRSMLARLPFEQAHLIELRLSGLTDKEIALVLGRSYGAVRVAQHRAVRRLRELLRGGGGHTDG